MTRIQASSTVIDVPPLREDSLRQVVQRPPALLGVCFEDESMGERVVSSTARQPGALPLLSYLLEDLWKGMQRRGDGVLRWSDYPIIQSWSASAGCLRVAPRSSSRPAVRTTGRIFSAYSRSAWC